MEMRNSYKMLVKNLQGRISFGRPGHRWEDNFKMGLQKIVSENVD
jgi:hypothetical protein